LQSFSGDFLPRPFLLKPMTQPATRQGEQPGACTRPIARLLEHDHGGQNCTAKEGNACHQADDKGLSVHVPARSARAEGSDAGKDLRRHHPFVGDRTDPGVPDRRGKLVLAAAWAPSEGPGGRTRARCQPPVPLARRRADETRQAGFITLRTGPPRALRWAMSGRKIHLSPMQSHCAAKIFPRSGPRVPSLCA
jgi:hypothetical protein